MPDIRYVSETDEEGYWIEAQLTSEGVIVDRYNIECECVATFASTYEECLEWA